MANAITITSDTIIKLLIRRGTDAERKPVRLDAGELGYTTDTERVYVGDGNELGGKLVGNLGFVTDTGTDSFSNPQPGDFVFETKNGGGRDSYKLFARNTSDAWVNIHPRYSYPFKYDQEGSLGSLNFNNQYLTLNKDTGHFGIGGGATNPSSRLTVDGDTNISGSVTIGGNVAVTNATIRNQPSTGTHGTNKIYVDSKFFPISSFDFVVKPYVHANFLPLSGGRMIGPIDMNGNILTVSRPPTVSFDTTNKKYVDDLVALSASGAKSYLHGNFLPLSGGTVGPVSGFCATPSPALDLRNNGTGPHFVAGTVNGVSKFAINNDGTVNIANNTTIQGTATVTSTVQVPTLLASTSVGINNGSNTPLTTLDVRGGVNIGAPGLGSSSTGDSLTFNGLTNAPSNTDAIALYRVNTASDTTELRTLIGDNTNEDAFVIGNVISGFSTWTDWLRVKYGSMTYRGNFTAGGTFTAGGLGQFSGTVQIGSGATQGLYGDGGNIAIRNYNGSPNGIYFQTYNGARTDMYIRNSDGWIGIGTTNPTAKLTVNGAINATGDIIAFTTSDARLKNDVQPIASALEKVQQVSGVEYDWNTELQSTYTGHDIGVLAQEIEKILPEAVTTREDGYKAVKYEKIIPLLIQAIKELKVIVDTK
jgi:hypothetical protein